MEEDAIDNNALCPHRPFVGKHTKRYNNSASHTPCFDIIITNVRPGNTGYVASTQQGTPSKLYFFDFLLHPKQEIVKAIFYVIKLKSNAEEEKNSHRPILMSKIYKRISMDQ